MFCFTFIRLQVSVASTSSNTSTIQGAPRALNSGKNDDERSNYAESYADEKSSGFVGPKGSAEPPAAGSAAIMNGPSDDWFDGVEEVRYDAASYDDYDVDSLLAIVGSFAPPPPRPPFLPEETLSSDELATCDLCSWALRNDRYSFSLDGTLGE